MLVIRLLIRFVVVLAILGALAAVGARYHDGPLGPLPGGPLVAGPLVTTPVSDWAFAAKVPEIELQLDVQSKSRTTWILVHDGKAYIPASTEYPPGKTWHRVALGDGRAVIRVDGKRYPVLLTKVDDPAVLEAVRSEAEKKYPKRPGGEAWLFAVTSRTAS
ncbi:MAG TPA: hypothetical protein VMH82_06800 [Myxococcota bacterium]|nr:hypothetical protein [Myxococcota bacterium]